MLGINSLLDGLVLIGELLGVVDHLLDLFLSQAALVVGDRDSLSLAYTLLNTGDGEDGVLVNLESDLNLGNTSGSGGDAGQVKLTKLMVVLHEGALSFEDGDGHGLLLVLVGGEGLGLLGRDDGTALNDGGHDTANGLNTECKWGNIDEKDILGLLGGLTAKNTALNSSAVSDGLIRVDASVGLLTVEEVLDKLLDLGDTGGASDEDDLVNLATLEA